MVLPRNFSFAELMGLNSEVKELPFSILGLFYQDRKNMLGTQYLVCHEFLTFGRDMSSGIEESPYLLIQGVCRVLSIA